MKNMQNKRPNNSIFKGHTTTNFQVDKSTLKLAEFAFEER